jgi:uncharacterized membrane protein YfcA
MTGPAGDSSVRIRDQKLEPRSDYTTPVYSEKQERTKRRALVFAGLFFLLTLMLVAMFERGLDSGIAARQLLGRLRSAGTDISFRQVPALVLLGVGAGLFSGMLGMGGGVLKIAGMLLLFKLDIFFARAVSLTTMFFATASSIGPYAKRGFPIWQSIRPMLPPAVAGLVWGVLLGNQLRSSTLACLFGLFMLFLAFYTLAMMFDDPRQYCFKKGPLRGRSQRHHRYLCGGIGVLHGFICGLLGLSGGAISVPMQQLLLNMPARNAIANTLVVSTLCSGLGSVIVITIGVGRGAFSLEHLLFALVCVGVGAVLGAQIGVRMSEKTSAEILKVLFVVVSFGAGLSLLI